MVSPYIARFYRRFRCMRTVRHVNTSFCHISPRGTFQSFININLFICMSISDSQCLYMKNLSPRGIFKPTCMFTRSLCSSPRSLTSISTFYFPSKKTHLNLNKTHFPTFQKTPIQVPKTLFVRMASGEQKFPPQKQDAQPGKEHVMDPVPQFTNPDYKPSNKLQVYTFIHWFYYIVIVNYNLIPLRK